MPSPKTNSEIEMSRARNVSPIARKLVRSRLFSLAAVASLLLGLIAIGSGTASSARAGTASPGGCPSVEGAVCGSLELPLDRARPELGTTSVAYVFIPHTGDDPAVSAIVPNPGGQARRPLRSAARSSCVYLGRCATTTTFS